MSEQAIVGSYYGDNALTHWGVAKDQMSNARKWVCFFILFAFGASCTYQYIMIAPVLMDIAGIFSIETAQMGWIMSVYTFAGLILAYPCTWVMQKFGIKFSLVVTAALGILGNLICLNASGAAMFLVGRAIQGCGFGLIAVLGPNIMPRLFPLEKQGLVMGIWSQWVTPGIVLGSLTTPIIFQASGWQALYYLSTALTVITGLLIIFFVKMPLVPENVLYEESLDKKNKEADGGAAVDRKVFVKSAFVVGFSFVAWCTIYSLINNYLPTYCQMFVGMDLQQSSLTTLVVALSTIPFGILFGVVADKIQRRKVMLLIGYATVVFFCIVTWRITSAPMMWVMCIFIGAVSAALVPTMTRSIIPVLAQLPKQTDWALTGMAFVTQVGALIAGFFPTLFTSVGWETAGLIFAIIPVLAFVVLLFVKNDHDIVL